MSKPQRVVGTPVEIEGEDLSPEEIMRQVMKAQFEGITTEPGNDVDCT